MEKEAHFTPEDRETLKQLTTASAVLASKLDRAIDDIAKLSNNFATKEEFFDINKRLNKLESKIEVDVSNDIKRLEGSLSFAKGLSYAAIGLSGVIISLLVYIFQHQSIIK